MMTTIQRWGNSQGIRIPKVLLEQTGLSVNDRVELVPTDDGFIVRRPVIRQHRSLKERLESFYGKPIEEITRIDSAPEVDWGKPRGDEVW